MRRLTRYLRIRAPFAQFRCHAFGAFRGTYDYPPPSTARGMLWCAAGLEMDEEPAGVEYAVGQVRVPGRGTWLQHMHVRYGTTHEGAAKFAEAVGACRTAAVGVKPARVEVLCGLDIVIAARAGEDFVRRLEAGMRGEVGWGAVCAGASDFPVSQLDLYETPPWVEARWLVPVDASHPDSVRLPVRVDHDDPSASDMRWYRLEEHAASTPPEAAWLS